MNKSFAMSVAAFAVLTASNTASAFFWDNDNDWKCRGPYGEIPDCNPYDEWDPRYWMEEMEQVWDDNDYGYGYGAPYGGGYGAPAPYGPPPAPYGAPYGAPQAPYGYGPGPMPMPAAPAPAPVR